MMNYQERIEAKKQQIFKMEKNIVKYVIDDEFTAMCDRYFQSGDRSELEAWKKAHNMMWLPDYYSKRYELEEAKKTLAKYQKALEVENDKQASINELPQVVIDFKNDLINRWDRYDMCKKEEIKRIYKDNTIEYKERMEILQNRFGRSWYEFMWLKDEQIHNQNVKDSERLVLDMIERTTSLTGKIVDCSYLRLDQDNSGYTVINGLIKGEKGNAKIESIGAGGYNIQRYHIRVLVKEVRA